MSYKKDENLDYIVDVILSSSSEDDDVQTSNHQAPEISNKVKCIKVIALIP